jgi:hypothetical protein
MATLKAPPDANGVPHPLSQPSFQPNEGDNALRRKKGFLERNGEIEAMIWKFINIDFCSCSTKSNVRKVDPPIFFLYA